MNDALKLMAVFFSESWKFFTTINFPGTNFTIAVVFIGTFLMVFSIRIISFLLGHVTPFAVSQHSKKYDD